MPLITITCPAVIVNLINFTSKGVHKVEERDEDLLSGKKLFEDVLGCQEFAPGILLLEDTAYDQRRLHVSSDLKDKQERIPGRCLVSLSYVNPT